MREQQLFPYRMESTNSGKAFVVLPALQLKGRKDNAGCYQCHGRGKLANSLWFDKPVLSLTEGLTMSGFQFRSS